MSIEAKRHTEPRMLCCVVISIIIIGERGLQKDSTMRRDRNRSCRYHFFIMITLNRNTLPDQTDRKDDGQYPSGVVNRRIPMGVRQI